MSSRHYDVLVCGGGPAGLGAAVAAARAGAKTLLVESASCLGGIMGNAQVSSFCDSPGGPVFADLTRRLLDLGAAEWRIDPVRFRPPGRLRFQPETARAVALELVAEAGCEVLLGTFVQGALVESGRVVGVELATKSGVVPVRAGVVVDCTADADVAASAGVPFRQGDPTDGRIQVCNFRWGMGGVDRDAFARAALSPEELGGLFAEAVRDGEICPPEALFAQPAETFPFAGAERGLVLGNWELQGVDPTDAFQVSRALAQCQLAALQIVRFCRRRLPGYGNCRIERFPTTLGTRESRRIVGRYTLTGGDVLAGAKFPDGAVRAWFWIDFHDPPPGRTIPHGLEYLKAHQPPPGDWYEIPYRCLLPEQIEGLLVAGRCLSCEREAQASLRVMPTCMFTGTVAGLASARAVAERIPPSAVDGAWLKRSLADCAEAG